MSNKQLMELSEEQLNFTGEAIPGTILLSKCWRKNSIRIEYSKWF